ncbi:MAG: hypothetical protein PHE21_02950 [Candidatus Dojkabacteria bacterium]|nr:hypothetical protein [Candidatus Dojkabacteria bacterium]
MTPVGYLIGTVRVNICGDGVADSIEECDLLDLKSQSCILLGYDKGDLGCKMTCEFDISDCSMNIVPEEPEPSSEEGLPYSPIYYTYPSAVVFLSMFDINGDGVIQSSEIPPLVVEWVNYWKLGNIDEGDLNNDGACDIYDFSTLMYYL